MEQTDLAAIRAALAAWDADLPECPDGHEYTFGTGWRFLYPDAPEHVRALLTALDARDAEIARLRGALRAIVARDPLVYDMHYSGGTCFYCGLVSDNDAPSLDAHKPGCAYAAARRALTEEDET